MYVFVRFQWHVRLENAAITICQAGNPTIMLRDTTQAKNNFQACDHSKWESRQDYSRRMYAVQLKNSSNFIRENLSLIVIDAR